MMFSALLFLLTKLKNNPPPLKKATKLKALKGQTVQPPVRTRILKSAPFNTIKQRQIV